MRWKAVNKPWRAYRAQNNWHPVATGMVLRVRRLDGVVEELVVGDVNPLGGFCDDCPIDHDAVVLAELDLTLVVSNALATAKEPT